MTNAAPQKPTRNVLLVDDDPAFIQFLKEFLLTYRKGEWQVFTADHYVPALECIEQTSIQLIVLDITMPVMDGLQFLRLLKRKHPQLPVVILTSVATQENRDKSMEYGAALIFDKTEVSDGLEKIYAALDAVALAPTEGFRGVLRQVGLPEILQMECLGRKSSVLQVTSPVSSGRIFIEDGAIVHAEHKGVVGEPALFQLLGLQGGEFQFQAFVPPDRRTIDGSWESLLMEAARLRDEATASEMEAAPAAAPGSESASSPAMTREVLELVMCAESSQLLYEWQSPDAARRVQLLERLERMAGSLATKLSMRRSDRLEVETEDGGRAVFLLRPDRKLFMRSGFKTGKGGK